MAWNIEYAPFGVLETPLVGALTLAGSAPILGTGNSITVNSPPQLALTGQVPTVITPILATPLTGTLTLVGQGGSQYQVPAGRTTTFAPGVTYAPTSGATAPTAPPPGWTGGIPARSTIYTTLIPSGADDTAAINAALAACPANQTVLLGLGQFNISGQGIHLTKSYVTLRGSGAGQGMRGGMATFPGLGTATLLVKADATTNPYPVITVGSLVSLNTMYQTAAFASDAVKGAYSVTLAAAPPAGMAVGEIVYCNETYDSTLVWYNTAGGETDNSGYAGWGEGASGTLANSRPLGQAMEIASIVGNVITFTTPFHTNYRAAFSGHLGRVNPASRTSWCGVENLFFTGGDGGDGGGGLCFGACSYSWGKQVEAGGRANPIKYGGGLVHFFSSFRCEIRDSYLHSGAWEISAISPGGRYYNLILDAYTADCLVENNISWIANKVMVMRSSGGGNVIGYNYMDDGFIGYSPVWMEVGPNADHMAGSHHELFEGNYGAKMSTDSRWGNSIYNTFFRNWASAQRLSAWPSQIPLHSTAYGNPLTTFSYTAAPNTYYYEDVQNRTAIQCTSHHFGFNYVGNVLGNSGLPLVSAPRSNQVYSQTGWVYEQDGNAVPPTINVQSVSMWTIGAYDSSEGVTGAPGNGLDPSVLPVTLRDANYDYYTTLTHWHGIGGSGAQTTPPGASATGSAVLPQSMYLPAAPAFFRGGIWPWVDGSNAANPLPGTLPARIRFHAGMPNSQTTAPMKCLSVQAFYGQAASGSTTTCVDPLQTWSTNQWNGYIFEDLSTGQRAAITGNTSNTLTFAGGITTAVAALDVYAIITSQITPYTSGGYPNGNITDPSGVLYWEPNGTPCYVSYDLSNQVAAGTTQIKLSWWCDATYNYAEALENNPVYYNCPYNFTIDVNAAPGGSYPTTGWVTVKT
ncbi:MAG: hypothetical protein KGL39_36290, partial [Patescibacteria group bacterium]|nr:hypothetical protein [Patescibacteria group bacterium]